MSPSTHREPLSTVRGHSGTLAQATLSYPGYVIPPKQLSIEPAPEVIERRCADCGRPFSSVHGFLYEDGDAFAVYHALLQEHHPSTVADIALSFGRWDEATERERLRVGLRVWPAADELKMHVNDPSESSWGNSEAFGRMAPRSEVLGTELEQDAFRVAEFVIDNDPRVREHLR